MKISHEKCKGCGACVSICPQNAIGLVRKKAIIGDACCECMACMRVCPEQAPCPDDGPASGTVTCEACPVRCRIKENFVGACHRYFNKSGILERTIPLLSFKDVQEIVGPDWQPCIRRPLITGIGAGTTYPDCKPAPNIVQGTIGGVDVVTVVTEAPLSYSGMKLKIDTDVRLGDEGAPVFHRRKKVGHLTTEEYGSKILSLGGVNLMTGANGLTVAKLISDLANRQRVRLRVDNGSALDVQVGEQPLIDGKRDEVMRVGCGSATLGLFAPLFRQAADEVIVIDSHLTGLLSEHAAGIYVGAKKTGICLVFPQSTPGRYFGDHGSGWGGTSIIRPIHVIQTIDMETAWPGMTILITETTGRQFVTLELQPDGSFVEISPSSEVLQVIDQLRASCQEARVSALYCGGSGGSARAGVTRYPIRLTKAVHSMKARLTVGGAPTFVLPGGGINFTVDVEKVFPGAFSWVPTPATVCPIEYTMTLEDFREMGGHEEAVKPFRPRA